jgi:hypothetical protein
MKYLLRAQENHFSQHIFASASRHQSVLHNQLCYQLKTIDQG